MKLSELFNPNEFAARHLSFGDEAALLEALGEKSMDDFVGNTVPQKHPYAVRTRPARSPDRGGRVGEIGKASRLTRDQQVLYRFGLLPDPRAERDLRNVLETRVGTLPTPRIRRKLPRVVWKLC